MADTDEAQRGIERPNSSDTSTAQADRNVGVRTAPADRSSTDEHQLVQRRFCTCVETLTAATVMLATAAIPVILTIFGAIKRIDLRWEIGVSLAVVVCVFRIYRASRLASQGDIHLLIYIDSSADRQRSAGILLAHDNGTSDGTTESAASNGGKITSRFGRMFHSVQRLWGFIHL